MVGKGHYVVSVHMPQRMAPAVSAGIVVAALDGAFPRLNRTARTLVRFAALPLSAPGAGNERVLSAGERDGNASPCFLRYGVSHLGRRNLAPDGRVTFLPAQLNMPREQRGPRLIGEWLSPALMSRYVTFRMARKHAARKRRFFCYWGRHTAPAQAKSGRIWWWYGRVSSASMPGREMPLTALRISVWDRRAATALAQHTHIISSFGQVDGLNRRAA